MDRWCISKPEYAEYHEGPVHKYQCAGQRVTDPD